MRDDLGVSIRMSDGVDVSVRIYRPDGEGPFPTLFAASPYRYDNDDVPETSVFFWHEVGPIGWYLDRGYAYVHLDVRGSGRSGGDYGFFDSRERRDLYEVIEWIAAQPWSNGKVGGIGQSYYAAAQWCMAAESPPHLACVAPYDGHVDLYRGWFYPGGILSNFASVWWNGSVRQCNLFPLNGEQPRHMHDLVGELMQHPTVDDWWRDRNFDEGLSRSTVPVYSIGLWTKRDLHLAGNVRGWRLVQGDKKLLFSGVRSLPEALAEFNSIAFHERVLAPFYDYYLKGEDNGWAARPPVEINLSGVQENRGADTWPPAEVREEVLHLNAETSGTLTSLNDGGLAAEPGEGSTTYNYPDPKWSVGPVSFGPAGPDPIARVLTFTSAALTQDVTIAGAPTLELQLSTTRDDANVIVKLSAQAPQAPEDRARGVQPAYVIVSKGWLRASQRAARTDDPVGVEPQLAHDRREPLTPGQVYPLTVEMTPLAHRFPAGSRIRLEITCADSTLTDSQFTHAYTPDMIGADTIHYDAANPSRLRLPVWEGALP